MSPYPLRGEIEAREGSLGYVSPWGEGRFTLRLYIKLNYSRSLIGSFLRSVGGQMHRRCHH